MPVPKMSVLERVDCIAIKYITVYGKHMSSVIPSKCKSKKTIIHNNFLSEVSHTITTQNFEHQKFFVSRTIYFFFARLNRFLYFWVFKCQISACRFLNYQVKIFGIRMRKGK